MILPPSNFSYDPPLPLKFMISFLTTLDTYM